MTSTSPVPTSSSDRKTLEPLGPQGNQLTIALKPVGVFESASMEYEINKIAPAQHGVSEIREDILDVARSGVLIADEEKDRALELLQLHFDTLYEIPGAEGSAITAFERREALRIITDIQMTEEAIRTKMAAFAHRLTAQSLIASAFTIETVVGADGKAWELERQHAGLSEDCLTRIAKHLGAQAFSLLNMQTYSYAFFTETAAKNSAGPSKSTSKTKTTTSATTGSEKKAESTATASSTKKKTPKT